MFRSATVWLPLVVSLHGSDVYVAEKLAPARIAARWVFRRAGVVTACSSDLARRAIALGADPGRIRGAPLRSARIPGGSTSFRTAST